MLSPAECLPSLIAISDPAQRQAGIAGLVQLLGVDACIIFVRDPELDVLLPAPGFPQTLPGWQAWRLLLERCLEEGMCQAEVSYPGADGRVQASGLMAADGSVLALIGQHADLDRAASVSLYLPLLTATLRQERAGQAAAEQAKVARETAAQLGAMATTLETTRLALQKALQVADEANERLEHELVARKQAQRALEELNETLEERVQARTREVRELALQLTVAEQRERQRIVGVLHDDIQQMLVALHMSLYLTGQEVNGVMRSRLQEMEQSVQEIIEATRTLMVELDSPARRSEEMVDAFTWLAELMRERYQLEVNLELSGRWPLPNPDTRELIVQLTRELLFNVVKHAGVDRVRLSVRHQEEALVVEVEDDGAGFDVEVAMQQSGDGHGFGLFSVHERAALFGGRLEVDSAPGRGTRARIVLPVDVPDRR